jgi:hypothetical protein
MTTTNDNDDRAHAVLERQAREAFDESVAGLDGATLSRLNRSRQQALAAVGQRRSSGFTWKSWMPAGALAATALIAVLIWRAPDAPAPATTLAADPVLDMSAGPLAVVAAGEDLDLATQADLDFYAWVDVETAAEGNT